MVEQSYCISVQCVPVGRWRLMSQPVVAPLPNKKLECSCHADTAHISVSASEGVANIPLRRCEVAMWCKLSWHHVVNKPAGISHKYLVGLIGEWELCNQFLIPQVLILWFLLSV